MTIYIAGKITGEPIADCTMKFGRVQRELEALGHTVLNPLEIVGTFNISWEEAMKKCVSKLMSADLAYFMPCKAESKGAMIEFNLCRQLSITTTEDIKTIPFLAGTARD